MADHEAIVVGAGPNGLAAAIELARAGWQVTLCEAQATVGGGMRTAELTLPGFRHDVCSAMHPLGRSSPFFQSVPLESLGVEWLHAERPLAHPLDDGSAVTLARSVAETAEALGADGRAWQQMMGALVAGFEPLVYEILGPLRVPRHPLVLARFGRLALQSAKGLATRRFDGARAQALFSGIAAHVMLPLDMPPTAAFGLVLAAAAHAVGWPLARGGSQAIADALATYFRSLGGTIITGHAVENIDELPAVRAVVFDVSPRQLVAIARHRLPSGYVRQLERFRYGSGVFKMDWALSEPVPWRAAECRRAATVHLGGTLGEIALAERTVWQGRVPDRPYMLVGQQSLVDATRAPAGQHTLWAYCHVPHGSDVDMTERMEAQLERFAPGFRDTVLARHSLSAPQMEAYNPNYVGGDINGGMQSLRQMFTRPAIRRDPYSTPHDGIFICSSSTPPGGGVHGMCGFHAARSVLRKHGAPACDRA